MTKKYNKKAWIVIDVNNAYIYSVGTHRSIALKWRIDNASGRDGCLMAGIKVLPCTITYELTPPKRKSGILK